MKANTELSHSIAIMVLEYFTKNKKGKQPAPVATATPPAETQAEDEAKSPVLTKEDEDFFKRIIAEDHQSPSGGQLVIFDKKDEGVSTDPQVRLMDGADKLPLPETPETETTDPIEKGEESATKDGKDATKLKDPARRKSYLAYIQKRIPNLPFGKDATRDAARKQAGNDLADVAGAVKAGESLAPPTAEEEAEREKKDLTNILDQLNLSALNNRAFSFSESSQKLMDEFTQILKDLINGVPTAYDDLEKLLTKSDKTLKETFKGLPPFIQKFIKTLPTKLSASVAPGLLAAASEKPGADGAAMGMKSTSTKYLKTVPGLKSLISTDAIVGMLRTILNFLKLRFPAVISGTNILLSVAVFCKSSCET